ncbi:MAG: phasin family protein [Hyphomicrobiaceae bacterium]
MAHPPNFEIPQQLRELTEKNLEQARVGYGQFLDAMTQAMAFWTQAAPATASTAGFKVVQERAVKFAKQNAEACFNLASELTNAKDLTDVVAIQARHAQTLMQAYALQAQELSRLMMEASQSMQQK